MVAATNHEHEQVDGVRNAKVHSIFFEDLPITSAAFTGVDQVREVLGIGVDMDVNKQQPNTQSRKACGAAWMFMFLPVHVAACRGLDCLSAWQAFPN